MKIKFDRFASAMYISVKDEEVPGEVIETVVLGRDTCIDLNEKGELVGVEIGRLHREDRDTLENLIKQHAWIVEYDDPEQTCIESKPKSMWSRFLDFVFGPE